MNFIANTVTQKKRLHLTEYRSQQDTKKGYLGEFSSDKSKYLFNNKEVNNKLAKIKPTSPPQYDMVISVIFNGSKVKSITHVGAKRASEVLRKAQKPGMQSV